MSKDGRIWLSHTGLEALTRCPRCFWLQYNKGIRQPEGIQSRLANRFDKILKNYFNCYRGTGEIPGLVAGKLEGKLQNPFQETYFYTINTRFGFYGKLDECLVSAVGKFIPVDFKTASSDPREKEILEAYLSQIDDYLFLLRENRKPILDYGYLVFFFPELSNSLHEKFPIAVEVKKVVGNPDNTSKRIKRAVETLESPIPDFNPECNFCNWFGQVNNINNTSLPEIEESI